jgi:hypothetical protein
MTVEAEPLKTGGQCNNPAAALIIPMEDEEKEDHRSDKENERRGLKAPHDDEEKERRRMKPPHDDAQAMEQRSCPGMKVMESQFTPH